MHAKLIHAQRGQAVIETVVFLPMFLLALFGIIWAVQAAVQYERTESAVRYSGLISQYINPYTDYSLYSMYNQLGSSTLPAVSCGTILTTPLSDGTPTYTSVSGTTFFSPTTSSSSCLSSGFVGWPSGTGLTQDVILSQVKPSVTSNLSVPTQLRSTLGTLTQSSADGRFFKPVGINTIMACYPSLNQQVTISLQYASDTSLAVLPVALPSTVTALTPAANAACTSH